MRFEDLTAVLIDGNHWSVYFVEPEAIARLREEPAEVPVSDDGRGDDDELWEDDEALVRLSTDDYPPYTSERDLMLEAVRRYRWDVASECFVDDEGTRYDFIYAQCFADAWKQRA